MAFVDVIDDYSQGASGSLTDSNGDTVTYTVTDGATTINRADHGNNSARIDGQGNETVEVTFSEPVVGTSVTFQGSDDDEFYSVIIDGVVVNLSDLVASGDVTFLNVGTVATHTVNDDGTISGGTNTDGSIGQLIFNFPVTTVGVVGAAAPSAGNFDGIEIGLDSGSFNVVCFAAGTHILTPNGTAGIETLQVGDMVTTADHGDQPILWIKSRSFKRLNHNASAKLRPVRICAGALGQGLPHADLWVSRQHRMVVSSKIVERMFGVREVMIPAVKLTALPGIYVDEQVTEVTYVHMLFGAHEVVFANGSPSESLYTGEEALKSMPQEACEELLDIFPELADPNDSNALARTVPPRKKQRELIARHDKNVKDLLELRSS